VVTRRQLRELGFSAEAIRHRVARGRLHRVYQGVYIVGRPQLNLRGRWMAAVLSCGRETALSHASAAALWGIRTVSSCEIEVTVPVHLDRCRSGILVHRRSTMRPSDVVERDAIPVTTPICTLVDLATRLDQSAVEAAINEADKLGLTDPEELRSALDDLGRRPGVRALRETLDKRTFRLADSDLERRFLRLVRSAGLPDPLTQQHVNGFRVDFFWPELGLIVETDGLRYHRTPAQQTRDRVRDQVHTARGLTPLRFTRAQVRFEPGYVEATLTAVADRLGADQRLEGN
jgi:very-short-patch-repair endonuclease